VARRWPGSGWDQPADQHARAHRVPEGGGRCGSAAHRHRPHLHRRGKRGDDRRRALARPRRLRRGDQRRVRPRPWAPGGPPVADPGQPSPAADRPHRALLPASGRRQDAAGGEPWDHQGVPGQRQDPPGRPLPGRRCPDRTRSRGGPDRRGPNHYNLSERSYEDVVDYCARERIVFVAYFPSTAWAAARPSSSPSEVASRRRSSRWPGCCGAPRRCCRSQEPSRSSI
jgi:hypothetical protein